MYVYLKTSWTVNAKVVYNHKTIKLVLKNVCTVKTLKTQAIKRNKYKYRLLILRGNALQASITICDEVDGFYFL